MQTSALISRMWGAQGQQGGERGAGGARLGGEEKGGIASVPIKDAKELGPFLK